MSHSRHHISVVTRVLQRRGWVDGRDLAQTCTELRENASANELLDHLVHKRLLKVSQAKELRLGEDTPDHIDDFDIIGKLGSGAMGTVYLAEQERDGQSIRAALKVVNSKHMDDEEFIGRFNLESAIVTKLDHVNIAQALQSGTWNNQLYLAMEYIHGPSLADLVQRHGPLPEQYVVHVIAQVCKGLAYAYDQGQLIHRDIKPENILVVKVDPEAEAERAAESGLAGAEGAFDVQNPEHVQVKIIDFGLAKSVEGEESLTMTGMTMGTPHYMSPEQICGRKDLDCRADIYGLGCTMFYLLTGKTPYHGDSPGGIMMAHINDSLPDPGEIVPGLSVDCRQTVMTAMAKERDDRFLSFQGFSHSCEELEKSYAGKADNVRLLRKPLVVKKTPKKKDRKKITDKHGVVTDTELEPISTRIKRKHKESGSHPSQEYKSSNRFERIDPFEIAAQEAEEELRKSHPELQRKTNEIQPPLVGGRVETERFAEDALRRVQTERTRSVRKSDGRIDTSIDSALTSGTGPLPLIVCTASAIVLIAAIIHKYVL